MEVKRTSVFENGLIWFGAAVSIAEILTGTYFAPLGFSKGLFAILLGHLIGCTIHFLADLIVGLFGKGYVRNKVSVFLAVSSAESFIKGIKVLLHCSILQN